MGTENNRPTNATTGDERKTNSTRAGSTGNSRGRRGAGGAGGATTAPTEKPTEKSVGLSDVAKPVSIDVPGASPAEEKPKSNRGRPKGSVTKNSNSKPKKAAATLDPTHLILLLQTVSGIVGSRAGLEMFTLSKEEATQIATPLAAIMAKNNAVGEFAGEYADHIALLVACGTIIIPKFLIYQHIKKQKEIENQFKVGEPIEQPSTGNDRGNVGENRNTGDVQDHVSAFNGSISNFIPPLV